jgi:hypothetical protein
MLSDKLKAMLDEYRRAGVSTQVFYEDLQAHALFTEPVFHTAGDLGSRRGATGYVWIQERSAPWVYVKWPAGSPPPPGWQLKAPTEPFMHQGRSAPTGYATVIQNPPSSAEALALIRQSAREAARAALDALRDARKKAIIDDLREQQDARFAKRNQFPRAARPARQSRRPRPARVPRTPRTPRPPRTNGTKGVRKAKPCKKHDALGRCWGDKTCNIPAALLGPNVGHSTCNWGPMDANCNCVHESCGGPAASLLKPFLKILPKYWTEQSASLAESERQALKINRRGGITFAQLGPRSTGANTTGGTTYKPDPRATGGGCACQDWPGWIICPNCSGGPRCQCQGKCIALPASSGNC